MGQRNIFSYVYVCIVMKIHCLILREIDLALVRCDLYFPSCHGIASLYIIKCLRKLCQVPRK